jgi:nicotinate-nucleotide adenylyltransferase
MIKTGILGGTFDPVHNGHIHIGKAALKAYGLDELWVLPNGRPPHKSSESITAQVQERLEMLELVCQEQEGFHLCTYEADRQEVSYSCETMEYLTAQYPEHDFYFIIGGDSLDMLATWREPERIMRCCTILVAVRNQKTLAETQKQIDTVAEQFHADIRLLQVPEFAVSSSEIRKWIRDGISREKLTMYVPDSVVQYMEDHGLYQRKI